MVDATALPLHATRPLRLGAFVLILAAFALIVGGYQARFAVSVPVHGTLSVAPPVQVQTRQTGALAAVFVRPLQVVAEGEPLFAMDVLAEEAALGLLNTEAARLSAERRIIQAARAGEPLEGGIDPEIANLYRTQAALMSSQQAQLSTRAQNLRAQMAQTQKQIALNEDAAGLLQRRLAELAPLAERRIIAGDALLDLEVTIAELQAESARLAAGRTATKTAISEAEATSVQLPLEQRARWEARLLQISEREAQLKREAHALNVQIGSALVRAPIAGQVLDLSVSEQGEVVALGSVLARIAPLGLDGDIVLRVPAQQIDQIAAEMRGQVQIDAITARDMPVLWAEITDVAQAPSTDAQGQRYYQVIAQLDPEAQTALQALQQNGLHLVRGLPVTLQVEGRMLSPLEAVFGPLFAAMRWVE